MPHTSFPTVWEIDLDGQPFIKTQQDNWCRELNSSKAWWRIGDKVVAKARSICKGIERDYVGDMLNIALIEQWILRNHQRLTFRVYIPAKTENNETIIAIIKERYPSVTIEPATYEVAGSWNATPSTKTGYCISGDAQVWNAFWWFVYFLRADNKQGTAEEILENYTKQTCKEGRQEFADDARSMQHVWPKIDGLSIFMCNTGPVYGFNAPEIGRKSQNILNSIKDSAYTECRNVLQQVISGDLVIGL